MKGYLLIIKVENRNNIAIIVETVSFILTYLSSLFFKVYINHFTYFSS